MQPRYQHPTKTGFCQSSSRVLKRQGDQINNKYKRIDILINAFGEILKRRSDVRLIIVGEGELRRSYEDLCSKLGIKNKVIFTGYVSNEELPKYYSASDLSLIHI